MNDPIDRATQRARAYWLVDGLPEILTGVCFLLVGLAIGLPHVLPPSLSWVGSFALPLVMLAVVFGGRKFVDQLKERITYPRTGYVAYAKPSLARRIGGALAGLAVAAVVVWGVFLMPSGFSNYIPLLQGAFVALIYILIGLRNGGLLRFYVLAFLSIGLGVLQMLFWGNSDNGSVFFYVTLGVIVLSMGLFHLNRYLNRPVLEEGE